MCDTLQLAEQDQVLEGREVVVNADAVSQITDGAVDAHFAFSGFRELRQDAQHGGLAGAVASQQREARPLGNFQIHAAQGGVIAEVLPDAISRDRVHSFGLSEL